jgi:predicted nucleic acid-binding protein
MLYALDSNVVIDILRGDKTIKQKLIQVRSSDKLSIPPYCLYEIIRGILDKNANRQLSDLRLLQKIIYKPSIDENDVMEKAAEIYIQRKKAGLSIEDADILIAAWCISADAVLVTSNTKHFMDINDLKLENWRK